MKLLSRKRLRINKGATAATIRWRRLNFLDIILIFTIPFHIIWGIASAIGAKEVLEIDVIQMNLQATLIYWGVGLLVLAHVLFNRGALIYIDDKHFIYRKRVFPPKRIKISTHSIESIDIEEKEDPIAETPVGMELIDYTIVIGSTERVSVRIKGLGEDDAKTVEECIREWMVEN